MLKHLDLFSGIGGFALACQWNGIETIGFVEIDKYCQKVLKKHWPNVPIVEDIRNVEEIKQLVDGEPAIFISGGFPCQPFSTSGRQRGTADNRYLWNEMLTVIRAVKPTWVLAENVNGIVGMALADGVSEMEGDTPQEVEGELSAVLDRICSDLEENGYEIQPLVIPACAVGAPHGRPRVWLVGNTTGSRFNDGQEGEGDIARGDTSSSWPNKIWELEGAGGVRTTIVANTECERDRREPRDSVSEERAAQKGTPRLKKPGPSQVGDGSKAVADSTEWDIGGATLPRRREPREKEVEGTRGGGDRQGDGVRATQSRLGGMVDGVPNSLDRYWDSEPDIPRVAKGIENRKQRLSCLGNAIVPQVAYEIIKVIKEVDGR